MVTRAFPVVYASDVGRTARFWERLGFTRFYQLPGDGEPGYVALRRGDAELAVVAGEWARDQYGLSVGDGPRFEMFVYADDVDRLFDDLRAAGTTVLRDPADMPWGERIASIADPDGNPVTLANERPAAQLGRLTRLCGCCRSRVRQRLSMIVGGLPRVLGLGR
jgi:lactoylglutathione lyase